MCVILCENTPQKTGDEDKKLEFGRMALIGTIGEFVPKSESWTAYVERVEQFFLANEIAEEKQVPTLLSVMGPSTYGLLRNLVQPAKPKDKTYDEIVKTLTTHFEPEPLLIAERFRFNRRNQKPDESVTNYAAELKQCAMHCQFGATLDDALRDRFVSGIRNEACQRKLLSEANLTFVKAFELAVSMETAAKDAEQLQRPDAGAEAVHKVETRPFNSTGRKCYRCHGKTVLRCATSKTRNATGVEKPGILKQLAELQLLLNQIGDARKQKGTQNMWKQKMMNCQCSH